MSVPTSSTPNVAYAVSAGTSVVPYLVNLDTFLHILASVVVIVSGLIAIWTYVRNRNLKK